MTSRQQCCHRCELPNQSAFGGIIILCSICGNKRCPHATDHNLDCTKSNEPGQPGSIYGRPTELFVSLRDKAQERYRKENMNQQQPSPTKSLYNKRNGVDIQWKLTMPGAKLPEAKRPGDVGFDVSSAEKKSIRAGETVLVRTGLQLASMSPHCGDYNVFLKVEGRSGMALKGIFPVGGIIDPTYRGEIGIVLCNSSTKLYEIAEGDRIAQLVVYSVVVSPEVKMSETTEVEETVRNESGFGSSGK